MSHQLEYNASEESSSSDPFILILALFVPPHCVGAFLDYEAGTVSFLSDTNHGLLIYKFSSCSFSQEAFPYFNPVKCNDPVVCAHPALEPSYTPANFLVVPLALATADASSLSAPFSPSFPYCLPSLHLNTLHSGEDIKINN